jgi:hypothetical protein
MSSWYEQEVEPNAKQLRQWIKCSNGKPISAIVGGIRYNDITSHNVPIDRSCSTVFLGISEATGKLTCFEAREDGKYYHKGRG